MKTIQQLILIIILSTPYILHAQSDFRSGFIVTTKNDTVHGFIDYRGSAQNAILCKFKKDLVSDFIEYTPDQILAYGFPNIKLYRSKSVFYKDKKKDYFLECLLNGRVIIYQLIEVDGSSHYFIEKDGVLAKLSNDQALINASNGRSGLLNSNQYKRVLKVAFNDCQEIQTKVENLPLTRNSLIKISKDYHDLVCKDQTCIIYERKIEKTGNSFGFQINYDRINYKFNRNLIFEDLGIPRISFDAIWKRNFGVFERWAGIVNIGYRSIKSSPEKVFYGNLELTNAKLTYDFSTIKGQFILQHIFSQSSWKPYVFVGTPISVIMKEKGDLKHEYWSSVRFSSKEMITNNTYTQYKNSPQIFLLGYLIGGGIEHSLNQKFSIFTSLSYEYTFPAAAVNSSGINLSLGILFR